MTINSNNLSSVDKDLLNDFTKILNNLNTLKTQITGIMNNIKILEKKTNRRVKNLKKEINKNKHKGNKKPSGFAVPSKI